MWKEILKILEPITKYLFDRFFTNKGINQFVDNLYQKNDYLSFQKISEYWRGDKGQDVFDKLLEDMWRGCFENEDGETSLRFDESIIGGLDIKNQGKFDPFYDVFNRLKLLPIFGMFFKEEFAEIVTGDLKTILTRYCSQDATQKNKNYQRNRLLKEIKWDILIKRMKEYKTYTLHEGNLKEKESFVTGYIKPLSLHKTDFKKWLKANWNYLKPGR